MGVIEQFSEFMLSDPAAIRTKRHIAELLQFDCLVANISPPRVRVRAQTLEAFKNYDGRIGGALVAMMLDEAMGYAGFLAVGPGNFGQTVDLNVSFIKGLAHGQAEVEASLVGRSNRFLFLDAIVRDANGEICARGVGTATIRAPSAG